jgi:hypothetical protein
MSPQADFIVSNGTGAAVRSDLNVQFAAIVSNNSGATEPATMYAYQWWADTTAGLLKLRNSANSAWITMRQLDGEFSTVPVENGSAAAPSIYFKDSGTDSGFFSPGTDAVAISTAGTNRLHITSGGLVGIGTSGPRSRLDVRQAADSTFSGFSIGASGSDKYIGIGYNAATTSWNIHPTYDTTGGYSPLAFNVGGNEALRIDTSQRVGIGVTTPADTLHVRGPVSGTILNLDRAGSYSWKLGQSSGSDLTFTGDTSERVRFTSDGKVLVGTSSARSNFYGGYTSPAQIEGVDFETAALNITCNNVNDDNSSTISLNKSGGAGVGSNTLVSSGELLGRLRFQGNDGTNFQDAAYVLAEVDGTPGANDMPGRIVLATTADGASSPTERMRITNRGYLKATSSGSYTYNTGLTHEFVNSDSTAEPVLRCSHTSASAPFGIYVNYTGSSPNGTSNPFYFAADSTTIRFAVNSNGGIANYQANDTNLSDRNAKKDITPAADTWNCLKEWEIVNYRYKDQPDDADLNLGVIAQQVAESCPEVITIFQEAKEATEDAPAQEERLGVKEQQMYWMAIKALQEAQARIEQLESKVAALESA